MDFVIGMRLMWALVLALSGVSGECDFLELPKQPPDKKFLYCTERRNWKEAKKECEQNNWSLSKIRHENDSWILQHFLENDRRIRSRPVAWTGLRLMQNYSTEEQYGEWGDGSAFYYLNDGINQKNESYAAWQDEEPRIGQDPCIHMHWTRNGFRWDNWKCGVRRTFFCEEPGPVSGDEFRDLGYSIIENIERLPATKNNTETILTTLDSLLSNKGGDYSNHAEVSRDGDVFIPRTNIEASVNISDGDRELTYQVYKKNGDKIALRLDTNLLKEARHKLINHSNTIQVGSIAYKTPMLFHTDSKQFNATHKVVNRGYAEVQLRKASGMFGESEQARVPPKVLTDIISADVSHVTLKNLTHKIRINIELDCKDQSPPLELVDMAPIQGVRCAFWNVDTDDWSSDGCAVVASSGKCHTGKYPAPDKMHVTCECDHMTHFTAILDTSYTYAPTHIGYLNMIGCIVSAFFLLLTALSILSSRNMRKDVNKRIILNIAINLFVMNLIFVVGIDERKSQSLCLATSFLLHYFALTSWLWMLLEAMHLLFTLSLMNRNGIWMKYLLGICGILAYVIPGIIAAVAMTVFEQYRSVKFCWIAPKVAIYTLALPIAFILVVNFVVAIYTLYSMTCGFKMKNITEHRAWINLSIKRSVCLAFLLGIPWTFGMLMLLCQTPEAKHVFAAIFAVCNMLQGVVIFVAFCTMDERFRKNVVSLCSTCKTELVQKIPSLSSYTVKPVVDQKANERKREEHVNSRENLSRKTSATVLSSSPKLKSKAMSNSSIQLESPQMTKKYANTITSLDEVNEETVEVHVSTPMRRPNIPTELPDVVVMVPENVPAEVEPIKKSENKTHKLIADVSEHPSPSDDDYDYAEEVSDPLQVPQQNNTKESRTEYTESYLKNTPEKPFRNGWA